VAPTAQHHASCVTLLPHGAPRTLESFAQTRRRPTHRGAEQRRGAGWKGTCRRERDFGGTAVPLHPVCHIRPVTCEGSKMAHISCGRYESRAMTRAYERQTVTCLRGAWPKSSHRRRPGGGRPKCHLSAAPGTAPQSSAAPGAGPSKWPPNEAARAVPLQSSGRGTGPAERWTVDRRRASRSEGRRALSPFARCRAVGRRFADTAAGRRPSVRHVDIISCLHVHRRPVQARPARPMTIARRPTLSRPPRTRHPKCSQKYLHDKTFDAAAAP
jgi:hypothetical protein